MTRSSRKDFISITLATPYDITRRDIAALETVRVFEIDFQHKLWKGQQFKQKMLRNHVSNKTIWISFEKAINIRGVIKNTWTRYQV